MTSQMGEKSPGAVGSPQGKISSSASASALQQLQMQQQQLIAQVQLVQQRMLMVRELGKKVLLACPKEMCV